MTTSPSSLPRAPGRLGLWHLALSIADADFDATARFYREGMDMAVDWQPDGDAIYLSSGRDNLALHRHRGDAKPTSPQALDHLGFIVDTADEVRAWYDRLAAGEGEWRIELLTKPRLHRDGATSFYFLDPAGHKVQIVHIPNVSEAHASGTSRRFEA